MANVGAPSSDDAVVLTGSRLLKSVAISLLSVPPAWMSVRTAVDDVVVAFTMAAPIGAALKPAVVVAVTAFAFTVVTDFDAVVAFVAPAVVVVCPGNVDSVATDVEVVVSPGTVVDSWTAVAFLPLPP